jgi:hypothetical protein
MIYKDIKIIININKNGRFGKCILLMM